MAEERSAVDFFSAMLSQGGPTEEEAHRILMSALCGCAVCNNITGHTQACLMKQLIILIKEEAQPSQIDALREKIKNEYNITDSYIKEKIEVDLQDD